MSRGARFTPDQIAARPPLAKAVDQAMRYAAAMTCTPSAATGVSGQGAGVDRPATVKNARADGKSMPWAPRQTKTEREYQRVHAAATGRPCVWCPVTITLKNGHRYTPDLLDIQPNGRPCLIEVKGAYKLGSYQRARMAFDQARLETPWADWLWAEKRSGEWVVECSKPERTI